MIKNEKDMYVCQWQKRDLLMEKKKWNDQTFPEIWQFSIEILTEVSSLINMGE